MSDSYNTLFFNHFHTPKSNEYLDRYLELGDFEGDNHYGSPIKILEMLNEGQNAVITVTEHVRSNGIEFYKDIVSKIEEKGGKGTIGEKSVDLELQGKEMKIINGVEATYKGEDNEIILAGLPIEKPQTYILESREELSKSLEKAEYAHPAHPFLSKHGIEEPLLEEICETIKKSNAKLFLPYTTAYGPEFDKRARGTKKSEKTIYDYANRYSANLIVEQDHHIHLPNGLNGIGLLSDSALGKKIPLEEIEKSKIVKPNRRNSLRDFWRIGRTFAGMLPGYESHQKFWKIIKTPYTEEDYKKWRNKYYKKELKRFRLDKIRSRTRKLNE